MAEVFDDSRLDDEAALAAADARCAPSPRRGRGCAARRDEAAEAIDAAVAGGRRLAAARRRRRRTRLPAAARGARALVPGAVRGLARARRCRAGPAPSTWSSCSPPRAATPAPPPPSPRRCAAAAGSWWPARRARSSQQHAVGRDSTVLPCASGDQLATAVVMLQLLDRLDLGPDTRRGVGRAGARRRGDRLLAAPRPRREPRQDAGDRAGRRDARSSGAGRCSPPAPPAGSRSRCAGPAAAPRWPATPSTCSRSSSAAPAARPVRRPLRRRRRGRTTGRPVLVVLDDGADGGHHPRAARPAGGRRAASTGSAWRRSRATRDHRRGEVRRPARHRHLRRRLPRRRPLSLNSGEASLRPVAPRPVVGLVSLVSTVSRPTRSRGHRAAVDGRVLAEACPTPATSSRHVCGGVRGWVGQQCRGAPWVGVGLVGAAGGAVVTALGSRQR